MQSDPNRGLGATLGELSLGRLTVVSETDPVAAVATALAARGVSCALLAEPPLRVVTERDLVNAWADGRGADDEVGAVATDRPYWAPASASVAEAAAIMVDLGIRHLVVLDREGQAIGVVSMAELFSVLVRAQEPAALYASFATVLLRSGRPGEPDEGR
ncbi:MAG TPA: CBS domain-containing protein [Acidimicrobiales bacterium]|nr:CBS domain-containing protein [Acidimicrobiales bacterium]